MFYYLAYKLTSDKVDINKIILFGSLCYLILHSILFFHFLLINLIIVLIVLDLIPILITYLNFLPIYPFTIFINHYHLKLKSCHCHFEY